jgi:hypothetical protein
MIPFPAEGDLRDRPSWARLLWTSPLLIAAIIILPDLRVVKMMSKFSPKGTRGGDPAAFPAEGRESGSLGARSPIPHH